MKLIRVIPSPLSTYLVDESGEMIDLPEDRAVAVLVLQTRFLFQAPGTSTYSIEHTVCLEEL
jgi:hypothetical protein